MKILRFISAALVILTLPLCALATPEEVIYEGCLYGETTDLSEFNLNQEQFDALYKEMLYDGRLPWFVDIGAGYNYGYNESSGLVMDFTPNIMDAEVYDHALYEEKLAEVMERCILDGMTPLQIALSVHDYLILHNVYDESLEKNTGYDLLINGTTVCAGYAALYKDILNRAGVPCVYVRSDPMEHAWNLVQLEGQWYHVDLTWDDPSPDVYGRVSHSYFLLTDAEIASGEEPHHDWETELVCTDTRYENGYWRNVESAICFESSDVSYLIRSEDWDNRIFRRDEKTGNEKQIYDDTDHYIHTDDGNYSYAYVHHGLALQDGRLYFNTQDTLRSMNTDGSDVQKLYSYDTRSNHRFILGFHLSGSTAFLSLGDHDYKTITATETLDIPTSHSHSFTRSAVAPGCTQQGYTASVCECGLSCQSNFTRPAGHTFQTTCTKKATLFEEGSAEAICSVCNTQESRILPKLLLSQWILQNFVVIAFVVLAASVLPPIICWVVLKRKTRVKQSS